MLIWSKGLSLKITKNIANLFFLLLNKQDSVKFSKITHSTRISKLYMGESSKFPKS